MARTIRESDAGFGSDSFLDVIANMVGILIILVVVVGIRVKQMPQVSKELDPAVVSELASRDSATRGLEADVLDLDQQRKHVHRLTAARADERAALALLLADGERELNARRSALGKHGREQFDLERELSASKSLLERVERDRDSAKNRKSKPVEIRNYPTPISQTVFGSEAHFQLQGGKIVYVPFEELLESCKDDFHRKYMHLRDEPELIETVGPRNGFRLEYKMVRVSGNKAHVESFELLPTNHRMGEDLNVALAPNSQFRADLSRFRPQQTTITLWTYPDSFHEFRTLKKELYHLGYAVAARPLEVGQLMGGSMHGTKSAAE